MRRPRLPLSSPSPSSLLRPRRRLPDCRCPGTALAQGAASAGDVRACYAARGAGSASFRLANRFQALGTEEEEVETKLAAPVSTEQGVKTGALTPATPHSACAEPHDPKLEALTVEGGLVRIGCCAA